MNSDTFRLPSTTLFLGLMPVFSGLARRADLAAVISEPETPPSPQAATPRVRTYIVHSGRESQLRTSVSLFDDDPLWNEGELSTLIKRQFGPSGLKHLLGVMIQAEEQNMLPGSQPGSFVFDASRHLDILAYTRSNRVNGKGYHTARHLREAREIVTLLCSLTLVQERTLGRLSGTTLKLRLLLDEASAESWQETVADGQALKERIATNEKFFLRFNPYLFTAAVEGTSSVCYQYTHQLRKLARENARSHGLALTLGVHLPIKFRLSGCAPLRLAARAFLRMAGIVEDDYTRYEHLERLEDTLRYMVEQGYIRSFETERFRYTMPAETQASSLSSNLPPEKARRRPRAQLELKGGAPQVPEPLEEIWQVEPPQFLCELIRGAGQAALAARSGFDALAEPSRFSASRTQLLLPGVEGGPPPTDAELLRQVRGKLGLQQAELARRLNVTQAAVSMAEAGKRPRMATRLLDLARRLQPEAEQAKDA